jgi:hypothetical protein|tara:strand:- start:1050 stop:1187 length:138 start_codon:yes stop_codon:yes gene_type:complete
MRKVGLGSDNGTEFLMHEDGMASSLFDKIMKLSYEYEENFYGLLL